MKTRKKESMKKNLKRCLALSLCVVMLICSAGVFSVSAASAPASLKGTYSVKDSKLTLTVGLSNNPGINTLVINVGYDTDALSVASVENGKVFDAAHGGSMFDVNTKKCPMVIYFDESSVGNVSADGVLVTVVFDVKQVKDDYSLTLAVDNSNTYACGEGIFPVDVEFSVSAVTEFTVMKGDVNGDGKVNVTDGNMILLYVLGKRVADSTIMKAIDINEDGKINVYDCNMIKRLIVGKPI